MIFSKFLSSHMSRAQSDTAEMCFALGCALMKFPKMDLLTLHQCMSRGIQTSVSKMATTLLPSTSVLIKRACELAPRKLIERQ